MIAGDSPQFLEIHISVNIIFMSAFSRQSLPFHLKQSEFHDNGIFFFRYLFDHFRINLGKTLSFLNQKIMKYLVGT
jgi:hypothetical protein